MSSSYAYSTDRGLNSQVHITATENFETISDNPKEKGKLKDYEKILKKMIYQTGTGDLKIEDRVRFPELYRSILKNLRDRGIDILPAVAVKDKDDKIIFKTENYYDAPGIVLAMFSHDIVFQNYSLHVFYPSSINYIFKQAIGVIVMSVLVTILLVLVILMLYRKMLTEQKLNQYKNDFINNLTHELKTPLATISLANSNIASAAGFSNQENLKQYTQIIEEENKKLNNHIEKVFELSLLEKERQMFEKRDLDLHEIIRESLAQNDALVKSSGAEIILSLNAATHIIRGDKFHLTNVISNLLDNAIKYNGGKAKVTIATTNERNRLVLTIKDNGIGISSEHQKLIFDKFFRVTDKDIHTTKGFGVGLSYVKQIVEHLGGVISVNSELNKGSEFTIILPYAEN
jgi:signal transduction histidine kinase